MSNNWIYSGNGSCMSFVSYSNRSKCQIALYVHDDRYAMVTIVTTVIFDISIAIHNRTHHAYEIYRCRCTKLPPLFG